MKKLFTLVIVSFVSALAIQAQTVKITKTDNSIVTLNASEVSKIEFLPATPAPKPMPPHAFTGYLTVTAPGIFTNKLFGEAATMDVDMKNYVVTFSDSQWGTGTFKFTMAEGKIQGTGKMKISYKGSPATEYDATMAGTMTDIKITVPSLMGGLVINWHYGKAPAALKAAGEFSGKTSLTVGPSYGPYDSANVTYKIVANDNNTINLTIPKETYDGVMMVGNLTIDSYTINNLSFNETTQSFEREYSNDGLMVHLKSDGMMSLDKDYSFKNPSKVIVKLGQDGTLTITNDYNLERLPLSLSAVYTGKKTK